MSTIRAIRKLLGVTQSELATLLGKTQGAVSFYENGATVPPEVAQQVIEIARGRGHEITFDHVYGARPIPEPSPEPAADTKAAA